MKPVVHLASFRRDRRAGFRWEQANRPLAVALAWDDAVSDAVEALRFMPESHPPSREAGVLPPAPSQVGPYRDKMFGSGRRDTHRIVFRVLPAAIELVALRHLAQDDLSPLDL